MDDVDDVFAFVSESAKAAPPPSPAPAGKSKGIKKSQGARTRKKLGDISNIPQKSNLVNPNDMEHLKKENIKLLKLLGDKSKINKLNEVELQKLRTNLQFNEVEIQKLTAELQKSKSYMEKLQLQNMHFAQANGHMLAELNAYKDRLKAALHEVGCRNGVVQALKSELEAKVESRKCEELHKEVGGSEPVEREQQPVEEETDNKKQRRQRSTSLGGTTTQARQVQDNKRRRQSDRFIREEAEKVDVTDVGPLSKVGEEGNLSSSSSDCKRLRPSREAAKKVNSYKETALNLKMRRPT